MEDVAVSASMALHADKLIYITETPMMLDAGGTEIRELSSHQAEAVLEAGFLPADAAFYRLGIWGIPLATSGVRTTAGPGAGQV